MPENFYQTWEFSSLKPSNFGNFGGKGSSAFAQRDRSSSTGNAGRILLFGVMLGYNRENMVRPNSNIKWLFLARSSIFSSQNSSRQHNPATGSIAAAYDPASTKGTRGTAPTRLSDLRQSRLSGRPQARTQSAASCCVRSIRMERDWQAIRRRTSPSDSYRTSLASQDRIMDSAQSAADGKLIISLMVEKEKLEEIQSDTRTTTV